MDNQRDDFNSRFTELSLKLDEIPRTLATLQAPASTDRDLGFTFRSSDEKLSLQNHMHRRDGSFRSGGGPYTDLQSFTIPDDMKAKVEMRIRQREMLKEEADAKAAAELSEAYRRLQLANNPRLTEVRIQVDQCQEQIKRAFQLIRDSNLHLYSCCESKVERMEFAAIHSELKTLRSRLREMEISAPHRIKHPPQTLSLTKRANSTNQPSGSSTLAITTIKDDHTSALYPPGTNNNNPGIQLTSSQIPELRVCLLELSRNFNLLKHEWKKKQPKGVNPVVKTHMEKVVAMINDAYGMTAEEPVDLPTVARHVERVSRVLGSDFSMQILGIMGTRIQDERLRLSFTSNEMVTSLCRYSEVFTDFLRNDNDNNAAGMQKVVECSTESASSLEKISLEMEELGRNQRRIEAALAGMARKTSKSPAPVTPIDAASTAAAASPATVCNEIPPGELKSVSEELYYLKEQMAAMRKQFVTEEMFADVLRQLETWKTERDKSAGVIGRRYMTGAPTGGGLNAPITPGSLYKRTHSAGGDAADAMLLALSTLDQADRPKAQTKLDPLHGHKLSGEVRPGRVNPSAYMSNNNTPPTATSNGGSAVSGRASTLSKIQMRSQMLRPKCNVQNDR